MQETHFADKTVDSVVADVDAAVMSGLRATISPMVELVKDANAKYRTLESILTGLPSHVDLVAKYDKVSSRLSQLEDRVTVKVNEIMDAEASCQLQGQTLEKFLYESISSSDSPDAAAAYRSVLQFLAIDSNLLSVDGDGLSVVGDDEHNTVEVSTSEIMANDVGSDLETEIHHDETREAYALQQDLDPEKLDPDVNNSEVDADVNNSEVNAEPSDVEAEQSNSPLENSSLDLELCDGENDNDDDLSCDETEEPDIRVVAEVSGAGDDSGSELDAEDFEVYELQDEEGNIMEAYIDPSTGEIFEVAQDGVYELIGKEIDGEFIEVAE